MQSRRRGFTILELLVVIVVVGILATLAVSRYINVKDNGLVSAATYDLDAVRKFLAYYSTDYSGFPLAAATYDDLKNQLVDPKGQPYGRMPISYTYNFVSYSVDADGNYSIVIQVNDHRRTLLKATPEGIHRI
jgi:prepilin-type N-terminal cleavage/methylation domain-containing protein